MVTYGGDEVGALVVDVGHHTTRAGHAGEDSPKVTVSTSIGHSLEGETNKWYVGDSALWKPKDGLEVINPYGSGAKSATSPNTASSPTEFNFDTQQGKYCMMCMIHCMFWMLWMN